MNVSRRFSVGGERPLILTDVLGLKIGALYEFIVTTCNDHEPHAAPMGIRILSGDEFSMRSYGETLTLKNLMKNGTGCLNVIMDAITFYQSLFNPKSLTYEWIEGVPKLKKALGWAIFKVENLKHGGGYYEVTCRAIKGWAKKVKAIPPCRASSSLIEALIHYTRIKYYEARRDAEKSSSLRQLALHHLDIVERTGWSEIRRIAKKIRRALR